MRYTAKQALPARVLASPLRFAAGFLFVLCHLESVRMFGFRNHHLYIMNRIIYSGTNTRSAILRHNTNRTRSFNMVKNHVHEPDSIIQHPVLRNHYDKMMDYKAEYGHPNIPLPEGKGLDTLRRLQIQNKLSENEVKLLECIGFRFHSLEDVYDYADFDDMFTKLLLYRDKAGDVSPPKKYKHDPELGAWVTGIRRRGETNIQKEHLDRLNSIEFQWTSPRQCGSSFMQQYRSILERKENGNEENLLDDEIVRKWVAAMQKASLSETREHYMETLLGKEWKQISL
jgi:Helicase associated domain